MKKILVMIVTMLFTLPVFAEQVVIDVDGKLTDQQKAELQLQAAKAAQTGPSSTTAAVKEWVDIGTAIGSGLASSARELGVAANDFASTPVGQLTAGLIVWHFVGKDFILIFFGFTWLTFAIWIWIWFFRRQFFKYTKTTYEKNTSTNPLGTKSQVVLEPINLDLDGLRTCYWFTLLVIVSIGVLPIVVS